VNVLVIPEDFRKDQYVLKPIILRMLQEVGKPNAHVRVCQDPLLGGISEATKWERIDEILNMYRGMVQLFLLIVDRDGVEGRRERLDQLERQAAELLDGNRVLFAENAWQEIEVWAIAGQNLPKDWKWSEVRSETHPKETYFEPLVDSRRLASEPGGGRTTLGREAADNYRRVRSRCPEDVESLENRIGDWINNSPS